MSSDPAKTCDYCGLPLHAARSREPSGPRYCCYGCRFAADVTRESGAAGQINWMLARLGLGIFMTLNVLVFTMALWTSDMYDLGGDSQERMISSLEGLFRYLAMLFSLPVLWLLGGPLAANAWQELRKRRPSTDLLLVLGVVASFVYSAVSVFRCRGHVYFEVGCVILLTVTLGRWLEATGKLKATQALDALGRLLPDLVRVVRDGNEIHVPLSALAVGDVLHVCAGERVPTDGQVVRGSALIDEQIVTGESHPEIKEPGDAILGGSHNLDGDLLIEVLGEPAAGTLQRLVEAVHRARLAKGRYQRLADRVANWFMPIVAALALATFTVHALDSGFEKGLMTSLSVVLIACPCALALATPLAVWTALGAASRAQVLFASGESLERLAGVRTICLDKTGTVTDSEVELTDFVAYDATQSAEVLARTAWLATASSHPLAQALARALPGSNQPALIEHRTLPGRGLSAEFAGVSGLTWLGSVRLMDESGLQWSASLAAQRERWVASATPLVVIGWQGQVRGMFGFSERLRPESAAALEECRQLGLQLKLLTGDHALRGARMAEVLGIPVAAGLLPDDKVAMLEDARQHGPVAMVGDGINDAPALAAADVGMALGCGADVSRQSADVCLLGNDLRRVPWAVALARRTVCIIRQNLFWAFFYNVLGVGLAAAGWLNPILASLAMVLSSALVVGNSLRLSDDGNVKEGQDSTRTLENTINARGSAVSSREPAGVGA